VLDAFIIEEIKKREREQDGQRPRLDLPLPEPKPQRQNDRADEEETPPRGVVIIDYSVPADSIPA
jgi:hypothetical protein